MPLYNFFRNLFGIPSTGGPHNYDSDGPNEENGYFNNDEYENQRHDDYRDDNFRDMMDPPDDDQGSYHGFNVFTDPLEIHRYFEQQMDEMMKSFHGFFRSEGSPMFGSDGFLPPSQPEDGQLEPPKDRNLRDHYLRPGYEQAKDKNVTQPSDSDLDGKIDIGSLGSILGGPKIRQQIVPHQPNTAPRSSFFGQSMTSKRIQRPDGSIEIHQTTRDHEGNEETTVTRQMGDKQYKVTTRKNKDGQEEKIEDIVNMEEKDITQFLGLWQQPSQPTQEDPNKYFPFDKFFK